MVLLRFAPSPTGALHLGGLRMALYNHLYARKHGGKWIMRVEDTDTVRTVPGSVDGIRKALEWAGLDYDYGPGVGGPHAPYFQSERLDLYHSYANKLLDSGNAYRCFCSPDKLLATRERLARTGSNSTYDRACLHLSDEEVVRKVNAKEKFVVRINNSHRPFRSSVKDLVFGDLKDTHASSNTDPVLIKSDRFPTYHLANVVDDHEMGVTHVLRGEEWITSLSLHLDLYAHLNLTPPSFAHIPVLLNADGSKMSKRNGDFQVIDFIRRGWEPSAVLNWIALAGWGGHTDTVPTKDAAKDDQNHSLNSHDAPHTTPVMTVPDMASKFELSALKLHSSGLDPLKLEHFNKLHLNRIVSTPEGLEDVAKRIHDKVKDTFPGSQYTDIETLKRVIKTMEVRLINIQDLPAQTSYFFVDPDLSTEEAQGMLKNISPEQNNVIVEAAAELFQGHTENWATEDLYTLLLDDVARRELSKKAYLKVLRHALTAQKDGPPLVDIMRVLGPQRTIDRLLGSKIAL